MMLAVAGVVGAQTPGRLPAPAPRGDVSVEEALAARRSVRAFAPDTLSSAMIGQLLWAAQGLNDPSGLRTSPSAGALYPLELYVATANGVFRYKSRGHSLERHVEGDPRPALRRAALDQEAVGAAPAVFVVAAVYERTAAKYGPGRARRYVQLEAGHAAQNLLLQAVALGLGGVPIGAFHDASVQEILRLPGDQEPLYLIPVGLPRR